jgi:toluene monooxygenase system protein E
VFVRRPPNPLRTYSHLADRGEIPSEYQIVSSKLLYYPQRGFEVDVPVAPWYQRYQRDGKLRAADWEAFVDPRETTYASYMRLQAGNEQHLDAVARSLQLSGHEVRVAVPWRSVVAAVVPPMRYVWHGFQMIAAYFGQMAPSGRLTLVGLFQAADELRRIHRVAEYMGQMRELQAAEAQAEPPRLLGEHALAEWQEMPAWQPLRRAVEEALCAYDWGESFAALNLGIKPFVDDLVLHQLGEAARAAGDYLLGEVLGSLAEDARWHREWTVAFVELLLRDEQGKSNREALTAWMGRWAPAGRAAVRGLGDLLGPGGPAMAAQSEARMTDWLHGRGLLP